MIKFFIPFEVQPKQADRSAFVAGHIRHYQPKKVTSNADTLRLLACQHRPAEPLRGPLCLELTFWWAWPKSASKRLRASGRHPRDTKPDFDNCSKQVCDVLQHAGFYKNDSQLADVHIRKFWGNAPGIAIELKLLELSRVPAGG